MVKLNRKGAEVVRKRLRVLEAVPWLCPSLQVLAETCLGSRGQPAPLQVPSELT